MLGAAPGRVPPPPGGPAGGPLRRAASAAAQAFPASAAAALATAASAPAPPPRGDLPAASISTATAIAVALGDERWRHSLSTKTDDGLCCSLSTSEEESSAARDPGRGLLGSTGGGLAQAQAHEDRPAAAGRLSARRTLPYS